MIFETHQAAVASLREFSPWLRKQHTIVRFWSRRRERFLYTRVMAQRT
jgi:hypothetical protein